MILNWTGPGTYIIIVDACDVQGASAALPAKVVTRQDAEAVVNAERRNSPQLTTHAGGVAESMETAATLNENVNIK